MKKRKYSKWIVVLVIALNVFFSAGVLYAMKEGAVEPKELIIQWFGFTKVEVVALSGVTVSKVFKEIMTAFMENKKKKTEDN